ncbi:hypothetical protein HanXRQr2_Chr16g0727491 [Helianthus annuus]|uniref:DUF4408 domain-containing protein n=1 Tax=Helianthus annuus TaxID=4232 RepID=A0A251RWJ1_HELAN|nr:uncharacterized protein LOC110916304 [Helianthus annuus]KAF5758283.1 hypothetical protein HanXRQr2_Chr16g0727491 [Helianthus annuus]
MDSYGFINSIQVEKANALARYKRFNNLSKTFRAIEVFVALALISWSSTRIPSVFRVSGEYIYAYASYVLNQHVVFLVGNVIVVVCYYLSGHTESDCYKTNQSGLDTEPEVSGDDNTKTNASGSNTEPVPVEVVVPVQTRNEKESVKVAESETDAKMAIKEAVKQIKRFHRTQSAKLSMEISRSSRELRRSVTGRRRTDDGDGTTSLDGTVERLSNEEFRLAVEAFISKQQSLLKQQSM